MAKTHLYLWHSLTQYYTYSALLLSKIPPHKNGTQDKLHLTKRASHKNFVSKKWHLKTLIGFLKYYQHPANKTYPYNLTQTGKN